MSFLPRPHQEKALLKIEDALVAADRFQVISACGTGKTAIECWSMEKADCEYNVLIAPSRILIVQFADHFMELGIEGYELLLVFSDKQNSRNDTIMISAKDIPYRSTTSVPVIERFVKKNAKKKLIISTYNSVVKVGEAFRNLNKIIDLAFCDEAHCTVTIRNSYLKDVLDDQLVPCRKRLFFTATPKILNRHIKNKRLNFSFGMSDRKIYGDIVFHYPYQQALHDGIITPLKLVAIGINKKNYDEAIYIKNELPLHFHADAICRVIKDLDIQKIIVYKNWVKQCRELETILKSKLKDYYIEVVTGIQPNVERMEKLDQFGKVDKAILVNHRCLSQGIDLPSSDAVYICDPIKDPIRINQIMGRAYRLSLNKDCGYVIIPIIIDESKDTPSLSSFEPVSQAFIALREQEVFNECDMHRLYKSYINFGGHLLDEFIEFIDIDIKLQNKISAKIIDQHRDDWYENIDQVSEYYKMRHRFPKHTTKLGKWWHGQRRLYLNNQLSDEKLEYLKEVGLANKIISKKDMWYINADELIVYFFQNGKLPASTTKLGIWWARQRENYLKSKLAEEKVEYLRKGKIPFPKKYGNKQWYRMANLAIAYYNEHGRLPKPGTELDDWWKEVKRENKKKKLSPDKIAHIKVLLDKIKVVKSKWYVLADQLITYFKSHNQQFPSSKTDLGFWWACVVDNYQVSKLPKIRYTYLKDNGIDLKYVEMKFIGVESIQQMMHRK